MKKYLAILITVLLCSLFVGSALAEEAAEAPAAEEAALTDGIYTIDVAMEGGSGKASIQSPCRLEIADGSMTATIIWSSDHYDYMIVDGERYEPVTLEGGSTFEIPVASLEEPLEVIADTTAMSQPHEIEYTFTFDPDTIREGLEDGVYTAYFNTDSTMFHVNEANEGKGILTVAHGRMTIHVSLVSKSILNLFPGLAEDAQEDGAVLLEPTVDEVTYSDGYTEEVYGFDIPVPVIDEDFDIALIGKKGTWYDHKVSVTDPQPMEEN